MKRDSKSIVDRCGEVRGSQKSVRTDNRSIVDGSRRNMDEERERDKERGDKNVGMHDFGGKRRKVQCLRVSDKGQ